MVTEHGAERIPDPEPNYWPLWVLLAGWIDRVEAWLRSLGGPWLRNTIRTFLAIIAVAGLVLIFGPVINKPLSLDDITSSAKNVSDNWIASEFAADYRIDTAADGTLTAAVEERFTANFSEDSSDTEIQRVLAIEYQDHALAPDNFSATLDGQPIHIKKSQSSNRVTLELGNDTTLNGTHDFVIRYTIHHLAYPASDTRLERPVDLIEWDVFGPSWPQGFKGLEVSVTLPQTLDDQLIRAPRGSIAWTLVGASTTLTPEPNPARGEVTYQFDNDQGIPPHANAWFTMSFEPGTFAMPEPSAFYWVKVFGPVVPLAFLLMTFLFALAARAVAWSDARGKPWYVAQFEPPQGYTPAMAAQILRNPGTRELAIALKDAQVSGTGRKASRPKLIAAARVARRTGRLGDLPFALSKYFTAPERRRQLAEKLRRVPHGFVRDFFIWAPIALTLVQWGLVRQLSFQRTSAVLWWPFTFVVVSTVIASLVVWIAFSQRPLTPKGALIKQHLLGIDAFASQTSLVDRGTGNEPVLPFAVLFGRPRTVGKRVVRLVESALSEKDVSKQWITSSFLTWSRLFVRALSVLVVAGAITAVAVLPEYEPYEQPLSYDFGPADSSDHWSNVTSFAAVATLSRSTEGVAKLEVVENLTVNFTSSGTRISQFAQQWPDRVDGQSLGVRVTGFTIDNQSVPFVTESDLDTVLLRTKLIEPLEGEHKVRVEYSVDSAAVAAMAHDEVVDRVRWAALLEGWRYNQNWGSVPELSTITLEFRLDADLADEALSAGWMTRDTKSADRPSEWKEAVIPFSSAVLTENMKSHTLTVEREENGGWPFYLTVRDVGPSVDFSAGTFAGPNIKALRLQQTLDAIPFRTVLGLAIVAFSIGLAGAIAGIRRRGRVFEPGLIRDVVRWLQPASMVAVVFGFVWMTLSVAADHPIVAPLGWSTLAAVVAGVSALALTRRQRALAAPDN